MRNLPPSRLAVLAITGVVLLIRSGVLLAQPSDREGWPAYHADSGRSGYSAACIESPLNPDWVFRLPHRPNRAWVSPDTRMDWDACFEPVAMGDRVLFGNSVDDAVYALDATTGRLVWRFFTDGPVRFAPCLWDGLVYVVSDDGHLYCLELDTGRLVWQFRGGPDNSMLFGNDRLISRWPARGAPVVCDGVVYFGCGIWPTDGVFLYALQAKTGKEVWCNDASGSLYIGQPHGGSDAWSGIAAQGYLAVIGDQLLVPTGRGVPAVINRKTGRLEDFLLQQNRSGGGGVLMAMPGIHAFWTRGTLFAIPGRRTPHTISGPFVSSPQGVVWAADGELRRTPFRFEMTPDRRGKPEKKIVAGETVDLGDVVDTPTAMIVAGDHAVIGFDDRVSVHDLSTKVMVMDQSVEGRVLGIAYASNRLFVATDEGRLYCFSHRRGVDRFREVETSFAETHPTTAEATLPAGFTVVLGARNTEKLDAWIQSTVGPVIVLDSDKQTIRDFRERWSQRGEYGDRVTAMVSDPRQTRLPGRVANRIVANGTETPQDELQRLVNPFRGTIQTSLSAKPIEISVDLSGEGDWTHPYQSPANTLCSDDEIAGPLAVRWFRDLNVVMPNREGRSVAPLYQNGRLFIEARDSLICVDAFTGRERWRKPMPGILQHMDQSHYAGASTGGNFCIDHDAIYLVNDDKCMKIHPVTGETIQEFDAPEPGAKWGYVAIHRGVLYGSIANSDHHIRWLWSKSDMKKIYTESSTLFAMNPTTGKLLWKFRAQESIRHNAIAIAGDLVYLIDRPIAAFDSVLGQKNRRQEDKNPSEHATGKLIALNATTGKQRWEDDQTIFGTMLAVSESSGTLVMGYAKSGFHLSSEFGGRLRAYRSDTGERLWDKTGLHDGRSRLLIQGEQIILEPHAYHIRTGKQTAHFRLNRTYGCGPVVSGRQLLLFRSGTLGYIHEKSGHQVLNFGGMRPGCWINFIPAGGLVLMPDASERCDCSYLNKASLALEPRVAKPSLVEKIRDGQQSILIIEKEAGSIVRYTTNGTLPKAESMQAPSRLPIPPEATLKLMAFRHGMPPSELVVYRARSIGSE